MVESPPKGFFADDLALSPVVGVVLLVGITLILAATVGTFLMQMSEQSVQRGPVAEFSVEYTDNGSGAVVHYVAGESLNSANIYIVGAVSASELAWTDVSSSDPGERLRAPNSSEVITVDESMGDSIRVVWRTSDYSTPVSREYPVPESEVGGLGPIGVHSRIAFVDKADGALKTVDRTGAVTTMSTTADVRTLGPYSTDFDGDGRKELPFGSNGKDLVLVDGAGQTETLVSGGVKEDSVLAVGNLDDDSTAEVLYVTDSDQLYHVEYGSTPQMVGGGIAAHSLAGVADFNGDGDDDVVFTDPSKNLKYYDDGAVIDTGVDPGNAYGVGAPMDFDGDGTVRVPVITSGKEAALVDASGVTEVISGASFEPEGRLGSFDWDGDGTPDIVAINHGDGHLISYLQLDGTSQRIVLADGSNVEGDKIGVA